ncbi:unnamed protein product [Ectocarpus sp. CCAP 1310/34]|nr:unnamed protein product [Ectocarpus sp. CCAP 1310/34]
MRRTALCRLLAELVHARRKGHRLHAVQARAPLRVSSGLGRWEGGDVRASTRTAPRGDWWLGEGCGEDVKFFKEQPFDDDVHHGPAQASGLSLARILYFSEHRGNTRQGPHDRPLTSRVMAFDYVSGGVGNQRSPDPVTLHPVLVLRGRRRPTVFPSAAIGGMCTCTIAVQCPSIRLPIVNGCVNLNDVVGADAKCGDTSSGWRRRETGRATAFS